MSAGRRAQETPQRPPHAGARWRDRRVVVVGAARSGKAAADLLLDLGASVILTDVRPRHRLAGLEALEERGAEIVAGEHPDSLWSAGDVAVVSPGVPPDADVLRNARRAGVELTSEIELAAALTSVPTVAITGSNGKSTVTAMVGAVLRQADMEVAVCGNIGLPYSRAVREELQGGGRDRYVVELSSFQCQTIRDFHPRWAAVLNLSPDHLDRHADFDEYAAAKLRIAHNCSREDWLVYCADDAELRARVHVSEDGGPRPLPFSRRPLPDSEAPGAWIEDGVIRFRGRGGSAVGVVPVDELGTIGRHNHANACAASALGLLAGAGADAAADALRDFEGLEHRMEPCATVGAITWINDSKATNVDATLAALSGVDAPVWLILGGRDKGADFERLRPLMPGRVVRALLVGEASGAIAGALDGAVPLQRCDTVDRAVACAARGARPGDVVLLAPACTSFDQFDDFEHRGRHFKEVVATVLAAGARQPSPQEPRPEGRR